MVGLGIFPGGVIFCVCKSDLQRGGLFFNGSFMPDPTLPPAPVAPATSWNPDLIFPVLADPARRKLLLALARGGPRPGTVLKTSAGRRLDATLKHLAAMRSAGLVVVQPDREDGRRQLYGLAPSVPLVKTEAGNVIDFGFCLLRL